MSVYGYARDTTPWLKSFVGQDNNILLQNAYSCHCLTASSLSYALTAKNQYNNLDEKDVLSLLEVANAADYETIWISNQNRISLIDNPVTVIASSAKKQIWINNTTNSYKTVYYDEKLLDSLGNLQLSDKTLVFIHLMGNHVAYSHRYPKSFAQFGENTLIDEYDNSMLYNDYVMKKLFQEVSQIPNFKAMVYFSDHGEDVINQNVHDPNKFVFDMARIPVYIHFDDEYMRAHRNVFDNTSRNRDKVFTNDLMFDLILSIMGIKLINIYDKENDLTSENYNYNEKRFLTLYGRKHIIEDTELKLDN